MPGDVQQVLLAGSFGSYLSPGNAVRIGLVPKLPVLRIVSAGNVAGEGAKMTLLSANERAGADDPAEGGALCRALGPCRLQRPLRRRARLPRLTPGRPPSPPPAPSPSSGARVPAHETEPGPFAPLGEQLVPDPSSGAPLRSPVPAHDDHAPLGDDATALGGGEGARVAVIACGALAQGVADVARRRGWALDVHPLPPLLHNQPQLIAGEVELLAGELAGPLRPGRRRLRRLRHLRRARRGL